MEQLNLYFYQEISPSDRVANRCTKKVEDIIQEIDWYDFKKLECTFGWTLFIGVISPFQP